MPYCWSVICCKIYRGGLVVVDEVCRGGGNKTKTSGRDAATRKNKNGTDVAQAYRIAVAAACHVLTGVEHMCMIPCAKL